MDCLDVSSISSGQLTYKQTGVKGFPSPGGRLTLDLASLLGPLFIMWILQLPLPIMVAAMSAERLGSQKLLMLRQGLSLSAYSAATYLWWLANYILFVALFAGFGIATRLTFFTATSAGIQLLLYIVWFHAMFALACWIAVFYDDMQSAVLAAVAMLIFSGLVANLVVVQFVESGPAWVALLLEALAPPFALFRALWEASQYAFLADSRNGQGLTVKHISDEDNGFGPALGFLAAHTVIGLWCAYYWEQVFVEGDLTGPRKHPFFPLGFTLISEDPRGFDWFWSKAQQSNIRLQHTMMQCQRHLRTLLHKPISCICRRGTIGRQHNQLRDTNSTNFARRAVGSWNQSDNESLEQVLTDLDGKPIQDTTDPPGGHGSSRLSTVSEHNESSSSLPKVSTPVPSKAVGHCPAHARSRVADNELDRHGHTQMDDAHIRPITGTQTVARKKTPWDVEAERQRAETAWRLLQETSQDPSIRNHSPDSHEVLGAMEEEDKETDVVPPAVLMRGVRRVFVSYSSDLHQPDATARPVDANAAQFHDHHAENEHDLSASPSDLNGNGSHDVNIATTINNRTDAAQVDIGDLDHEVPNIAETGSKQSSHRWRQCEHVAVKGLWLVVERGECFGLLGPNGAGKTTALRMMQGLLEVSSGSVAICGTDVFKHPEATATQCGICPQHDVLWPALSCTEHLYLYGRLRGLQGDGLAEAVHQQLALLGLADAAKTKRRLGYSSSPANRPCSTLSGGMRRRLSVGCALLGFPPVVFLDEPSAGLDPASRSALWQAVRAARQQGNTAAVLTTHSMAEAEALCDRIGIFVAGELQCVGSPQELTARYSHSLLLAITCPPEQSDSLQEAVLQQACAEARLVTNAGGAHQWEVPKDRVTLAHLFATVQKLASSGLHVSDWGISSATLDHVFSAIIAKHEDDGKAI